MRADLSVRAMTAAGRPARRFQADNVPGASEWIDTATEAMNRYGAGDDAAFDGLYEELAPRLFGYLFRRTRDSEQAADLVQQTFLQMHRARHRFIRGAEVIPWMLTIARRLMINDARSARRDRMLAGEEPLVGAAPHDAHALYEARQLALRLERKLARLPASQRIAFELKQSGVSISDAAQLLRISTGALKVRIHRAEEALRSAIGREEKLP